VANQSLQPTVAIHATPGHHPAAQPPLLTFIVTVGSHFDLGQETVAARPPSPGCQPGKVLTVSCRPDLIQPQFIATICGELFLIEYQCFAFDSLVRQSGSDGPTDLTRQDDQLPQVFLNQKAIEFKFRRHSGHGRLVATDGIFALVEPAPSRIDEGHGLRAILPAGCSNRFGRPRPTELGDVST
jgi:hypothetical protein